VGAGARRILHKSRSSRLVLMPFGQFPNSALIIQVKQAVVVSPSQNPDSRE